MRDFTVIKCLSCSKYTLVPKEIFEIGEPTGCVDSDLVCLNCFDVYEMESQIAIIDCYNCVDGSYFVGLLNPQDHQLYAGECSECGTDTLVRKCEECEECEELYHPSEKQEVNFQNKYFCSEYCLEIYKDCLK